MPDPDLTQELQAQISALVQMSGFRYARAKKDVQMGEKERFSSYEDVQTIYTPRASGHVDGYSLWGS